MKAWILAAAICLITWTAQATTIRVLQDGSGDYTAIQPAFDACQNGDTILIGAGTFALPDWCSLSNRIDVVVSGFGIDNTLLIGSGLRLNNCMDCELWSMSIRNYLSIIGGSDNAIFRCSVHVMTTDNESANTALNNNLFEQWQEFGGTGVVTGCVFPVGYGGRPINFLSGSGLWRFANCCFLNPNGIFAEVETNPVEMRNNIIWPTTSVGITWPQVTWAYNASLVLLPGVGNIRLTEGPFVAWNDVFHLSDLHLNPTSPCWDAGDPIIQDRYTRGHGTRSDIGCYGGMTPFFPGGLSPFPQPNVTLDLYTAPTVTVGDSLLIRSSAQIVPRY